MFYSIIKLIIRFAVEVFYKKIEISNIKSLPVDRPVIIASNHPNAFMDALVIAVFAKQKLNFLVRSDVFNTPLKRFFLKQLGLSPIYRLQEGLENIHKNEETFVHCNSLLEKRKTILMFPEGICVQEKKLRPLKKGIARIAFGAESMHHFGLGIEVVPVGVNYSSPKTFRSSLYINYGEPIRLIDFRHSFEVDKARAANEFTAYLQERMADLIVNIKDRTNHTFFDAVEEIYQTELMHTMGLNPSSLKDHFVAGKRIANSLNHLHHHEPELLDKIRMKTLVYLKEIHAFDLKDRYLQKEFIDKASPAYILLQGILLVLGIPLHLFGLLNNYLPYKLAASLADKKVKNIEFHSSVNLTSGVFLLMIFYLIQILLVAVLFQQWWVTGLYILLAPLSAWFSLRYWPFMQRTGVQWRIFRLKYAKDERLQQMLTKRNEVMDILRSKIGVTITDPDYFLKLSAS